jgi:hypothetical protein
MSGCGPRRPGGTYTKGKVGTNLSIEEGYAAARVVALNIRAVLGSLDRVDRVVKTPRGAGVGARPARAPTREARLAPAQRPATA